MADHIRYDLLTQQALRGVVRNVLTDTAKKGLPGDHHFYISFETPAEGVKLSDRLRAQYPEEMTIILQHQFWDLAVTDIGFEVGMSFGGIPEKLYIPFAAITGFFDPSVQFGLQFEDATEEAAPKADGKSETAKPVLATKPAAKADKKTNTKGDAKNDAINEPVTLKPAPTVPSIAPAPSVPSISPAASSSPNEPSPDKPSGGGGGEVVRLDRFRKK